ncbi:hypothetical protein ANOM_011630 [Aspergillus nomiae NRRL 13137]|uniref:Uncharacterized protein n=1 Tax=Aspergillus nomiae NRRL (strain ATCC 15546 / NRRL 13137 / CBS 260.88 / M93) TaxID=1509407 RepID=A0A0L1IKV5_ASPN3|nr:uncharacterized protein ANOM_011630 [Aspergillus nomiae NRRL 13137]KNG79900.1 hypothetical protein ANOM_011630 [Aspergillus nomiae NRRL 13137]
MSKLPKCEQDFQDEYERWKRESASINDYEACQGAFKSWIAPFLEERDFGYAALQRRCRLLSIKPVPGPKPEGESQASLPSYNDACNEGKMEEEIDQLMEAYWMSNRTLLSMEETIPLASNAMEIYLFRTFNDREGRPYSWVMDRATCADTGIPTKRRKSVYTAIAQLNVLAVSKFCTATIPIRAFQRQLSKAGRDGKTRSWKVGKVQL